MGNKIGKKNEKSLSNQLPNESHDHHHTNNETKIFLIRHAESMANTQRLLGRLSDSPLSINGTIQAKLLGDYFNSLNLTFDHVFTSTALRSKQTAQFMCRDNNVFDENKIQTFKEIEEIHRGDFEGKPTSDMATDNIKKLRDHDPYNWKPTGENAESILDVETRILNFMKTTIEPLLSENSNIAIVSHSVVIRTLIRHIISVDISKFNLHLHNSSVTMLTWKNGSFSLFSINDTRHLHEF